jgi:hypothetical protein
MGHYGAVLGPSLGCLDGPRQSFAGERSRHLQTHRVPLVPRSGTTPAASRTTSPSSRPCSRRRALPRATFSRTVWRMYGGSKGLVMWYYPHYAAIIVPCPGRHGHSTLPWTVVACHCSGIRTMIWLPLLSCAVKMTGSPRARRGCSRSCRRSCSSSVRATPRPLSLPACLPLSFRAEDCMEGRVHARAAAEDEPRRLALV